jgi:hypothetical protein
MWVLLLILAILLMLLGGGCTITYFNIGLTESGSFLSEFFAIWLLLGLLPLVGGIALWPVALKMKKKSIPPLGGDSSGSIARNEEQ